MKDRQKTIYVYENWSVLEPKEIGKSYVQYVRGEEIFSFEFSSAFLKSSKRFLFGSRFRII